MKFDDYQEAAWRFALPQSQYFSYIATGLIGEVGEFYGKISKHIRDGGDWANIEDSLKKELGDILWFVAGMATLHGWSLDEIAEGNIDKLAARKANNTIQGSGDDR